MNKLIIKAVLFFILLVPIKAQAEFSFKKAHIEALTGAEIGFSNFYIAPFIGAGIYPFSVTTFGEQKNQLGVEGFLYLPDFHTISPCLLIDGRFGISKHISIDIDAGFGFNLPVISGSSFFGLTDLAVLYRFNKRILIRPYIGFDISSNPDYEPSDIYSKPLLTNFFGGIGLVFSLKYIE